MHVRRTTVTATLLATVAAGGVRLASAGTAFAQGTAERDPAHVPGLAKMHQQMGDENPGMARMHQLMTGTLSLPRPLPGPPARPDLDLERT